jgi:oligopeptide transport system permease protein
MAKYIAKRVAISALTLFCIVLIMFLLMEIMPGTPFNDEKLTSDQIAILYQKYGLDQPVLGVLLGVLAAVYHNSFLDPLVSFLSMLGNSIPSYVFALAMMYLIAYQLGLLPILYTADTPGLSTILPSIALSMSSMSNIARFTRIPVIENLGVMDGTRNGVDVYEQKDCKDEYYYFGTDALGRDLWSRICYGTRISLYIALAAVLIDMVIGITVGMVSGYFGGAVDLVLQRVIEVINGIPQLVVVTLLLVILKPGLFTITLALILTSWIGMSRVVRAQVLQLKEREYILASRTLGTPTAVILFREILPNTMGQVIIMAMMSVPSAIFMESFLSFVGLGIPEPMASLGSLISTGFNNMLTYPSQIVIPVVIFSILMVSFNLTADGLRDALDPKMWQ